MSMCLLKGKEHQKLAYDKDFNLTFIDPTSIHLFKHFKKYRR